MSKPSTKAQTPRKSSNGTLDFYTLKRDENGKVKTIQIYYLSYTEFLNNLGFRRFDIESGFMFIHIQNFVIEKKEIHHIQDHVINIIQKTPDEDFETDREKRMLLETLYKGVTFYFNDKRFSLLPNCNELPFNSDTKTSSYVYYQNGYVEITKDGYRLKPYDQLIKHIWKSQILNRNFKQLDLKIDDTTVDQAGMYVKFIFNICNKDAERFLCLTTILGYVMHDFYDTKLKCVVLTDSLISENPNGRTGKTLLGKGLGKIRNYSEIPGKDFDTSDKFKYQEVNIDTQIVHINDAKKYFDIETLFNDISENITIEKKNKQSFKKQVKMMLSSNQTVKIDGDSAKDRVVEFELYNYYSKTFSPYIEFGKWFFSTDWNDLDWTQFDNFMIMCIQNYLKYGLKEAKGINLDARKLLDRTNMEFMTWMNEKWESKEIKPNITYDKKVMHENFLEQNPDFKDDKRLKQQREFTKYLRYFAEFTPEIKNIEEKKSNGSAYVCFKTGDNELL